MRRRSRPWLGGALGVLGLVLGTTLVGCDNDPGPLKIPAESGGSEESSDSVSYTSALSAGGDPTVVLKQVIQLIQSAATNPGGENFTLAAESLNDYFANAQPRDFVMPEDEAAFLSEQLLPPGAPKTLANPRFSGQLDGRHIEDCMLYRGVATAILRHHGSDADDDLSRAHRVFDWVVRQVQLVPPGTLAPPPEVLNLNGQTFQAQARPFDALLRGFATEVNPSWAERSAIFIVLCRQIGLDAGLIAVVSPAPAPEAGQGGSPPETAPESKNDAPAEAKPEPTVLLKSLACGVLIDGQVYLFDCRIGLPVPGPDGQGVATLEQAASDPAILARLDLPEAPYPVDSEDLSEGRVRVLLETTLGSLAPRMKLLQERLTGENRMVLYRNPAEVARAFEAAVGSRLESVKLWEMPLEVEYRLFHDGQFTTATLHTLRLFDPRWPLLQARLDQLRGETETAVNRFVSFRYAEGLLEADGKTPIPPEVTQILNLYATQFLALRSSTAAGTTRPSRCSSRRSSSFPSPVPASRISTCSAGVRAQPRPDLRGRRPALAGRSLLQPGGPDFPGDRQSPPGPSLDLGRPVRPVRRPAAAPLATLADAAVLPTQTRPGALSQSRAGDRADGVGRRAGMRGMTDGPWLMENHAGTC